MTESNAEGADAIDALEQVAEVEATEVAVEAQPDVLAKVQRTVDRYKAQISGLKKSNADTQRLVTQLIESHTAFVKGEYESKKAQLEAEKQAAAQQQDFAAYDRAATALLKIDKQEALPKAAQISTEGDAEDTTEGAFKEYFEDSWLPKNAWYIQDKEAQDTANDFIRSYSVKSPDASPDEVFAFVDKKMSKIVGKKPMATPVSGRAGQAQPTANKASLSSLPEDLKGIAATVVDLMMQTGKYKTKDEATASYMKQVGA